MRTKPVLALALLAGLGMAAVPVIAQERPAAGEPAATAMSLTEVVAALEAQGYTDFREVEREDSRYEVKARNSEGKMVEVYVDPVTLKVVGDEGDQQEERKE